MRRTLALAAALTALTAAATVAPAQAITNGEMDGDAHPYVGFLLASNAEGSWGCTGSLVSSTVFVTAGHCTYGAEEVEVWFDSDLRVRPAEPGATGAVHTHPDYTETAFQVNDLGVVVLDAADAVVLDEYAVLPTPDQLDALEPGRRSLFTAVGYGAQASFPDASAWKNVADRIRMVAEPRLVQINTGYTGDYSFMVSSNANTGGTCLGDSGGPVFIEDSNVLAGVTSFGKNVTCGGQSGIYRIDRADDLAFLAKFVG